MIPIPSIHSLQHIRNVGPEDAYLIRAWLLWAHGRGTCPDVNNHKTANAARWAQSCHHKPRAVELAHACVACIITEGRDTCFEVFQPQDEWRSINNGPAWEAVNIGDPYMNTLIYRKGSSYRVGCWGDLPEVNR